MASRENDFGELAELISTTIEKARQLNSSAYSLSMALAEARKAAKRPQA